MSEAKKKTRKPIIADNRFLILLSIILAVIFWAAVCISFSPETEETIEDVPITFDTGSDSVPSQYGLKMFGDSEYTVDITVSGSRYVIGGKLLSASDFKVVASTSMVTTSGYHSLQVKVSKVNEGADFNIVDVSDSFVNAYFDQPMKTQVNLKVDVTSRAETIAAEGYITPEEFSAEKKTVSVEGPEMEISQIDCVVANVEIEQPLEKTTSFEVPLKAVNKNGGVLKYITIDSQTDEPKTNVTIPIYKMTTLPVTAEFLNIPSNYSKNQLEVVYTPSRITAAVLQTDSQSDTLKLGTIDFSAVKPGENNFVFKLSDVETIKADSTTVKSIDVKFNLPDIKSEEFNIKTENITVSNVKSGFSIKFSSTYIYDVLVYGPEQELDDLSSSSLKAKIDFSSVEINKGKNSAKVPIYIKDSSGCWINGVYTVYFTATQV